MILGTGATLPTVPVSSANMHPSKCRTRSVSCYRSEAFCAHCELHIALKLWLQGAAKASFVTPQSSMTASCRQDVVAFFT